MNEIGFGWLAQYSNDSGAAAGVFLWLLFVCGLALIPATIAGNKGYSRVGYWFFGLFFFLPALIVALVIRAKDGSQQSPAPARPPAAPPGTPPVPPPPAVVEARSVVPAAPPIPVSGIPSSVTTVHAPIGPPPGPGIVRECPHCKEAMRRDASVCPHCRRESAPWEYREGRWWTKTATGEDTWYDEVANCWRAHDEVPLAESSPSSQYKDLYDLVIIEVGPNATAVARVIAEETGEDPRNIQSLFNGLPTVVVSRVGYATAEGLRSAVASKGAVAEIRKLT